MLPPVSEALGLLDIAFVHNEGHSSPAATRRAVQILVDHIQVQHVQLSRIEDILAAFGSPTQQGGSIWTKLAAKAELSRVEQLEAQLDAALDTISDLRSKQTDAAARQLEAARQAEDTREQLAALEARIVGPSAANAPTTLGLLSATSPRGSPNSHQHVALSVSVGASAASWAGESILERMQRLEKRTDALSVANHKAQEDVGDSVLRLRELDGKLQAQLGALRTDIKQALVLSANAARETATSEATGRTKDLEKLILTRLATVEESAEQRVAGMAVKVSATLNQELDNRFSHLYDHIDAQVVGVRGDLDRVARDKVDATALEAYTSRVSSSFEQMATALGDEVRAVSDRCNAHVDALRLETRNSLEAKAEKEVEGVAARHAEALNRLQQQIDTLAVGLDATRSQLGGGLQELQSGLKSVSMQADSSTTSISGLNSAVTSASNALELQAHKLSALGHRLQALLTEVSGLRDALFGPSGNAAGAALEAANATVQGAVSAGLSASIASRLSAAERGLTELSAIAGGKADEGGLRDVQRLVTALQRQADHASEGVRALTQTTYKRVDEHAAAIQKLTLAINSHMEERPTLSTVKHMLEASGLDLGERLASALLPVWEAVKALQGGMRELGGEVRDAAAQLPPLKQQAAELRDHVTGASGLLASLVSCAVEDQVRALLRTPGTGVEARLGALEGDMRNAKSQLEVTAAMQDRQQTLVAAVEDQLAVQSNTLKASVGSLRNELTSRVDSGVGALAVRVDAAEAGLRQLVANTKEVVEQLAGRPVLEEVRRVADAAASAQQRAAAEREEARWQAWVELHAKQMDRLATKSHVDDAVAAAVSVCKQATASAETAALSAAHQAEMRAVSTARAECDARVGAVESRVTGLAARVDATDHAIAARATQQDLAMLREMMEGLPDAATTEAGLRGVADALKRQIMLVRHSLEAELAKKLDVRTFLASSSAAHAAHTAGAVTGGMSEEAQQQSLHSTSTPSASGRRSSPLAAPGALAAPQGLASAPSLGLGSAAAAAAIARLGEKLRISSAASAPQGGGGP